MIDITEFDVTTGEAITTARVYSIIEKDGIVTVEGVFPSDSYYLLNGVVQPYTEEQKKAKALKQWQYGYEWDNKTMSYRDVRQREILDSQAKSRRDQLLASSDWTQLPDVPHETRIKWVDYRQALRALTEQDGYPFDVIWPVDPAVFTIYEKSTGKIERHVSCDPERVQEYFDHNLSDFISGYFSGDTHYVDAKIAVEFPQRPSKIHIFNYTTKQWEDPRTLADLKATKNAAINQARAKANQSSFTFQGKQISVDALSRSDIDAAHGLIIALQAMPPGWPGGWKAMDNSYVAINDVPTWLSFYGAMVAQGTANFNHTQVLKAQLELANSPAAVEAVANW